MHLGFLPGLPLLRVLRAIEMRRCQQQTARLIFGYGLEQGIVPTAAGRDMLMQAQAGTGKTAAFTIGMLEQLRRRGPAL